ncbi:hypothetical protein QBC40DRAFT_350755 [Triangularia verruculosa]|uniref:Uncharacterized protein n=1 Tax=Triangularia verruculosa TaxID=2587418 RepID=A0AAN6XC22_9PEZI|nr:hypothetical protein QBC40DRAFT_350755 [Triangularia verruculosa]
MEEYTRTPHPSPDAAAGSPSPAAEATPASPAIGGESPVVAPGFTPVNPPQPANSAELASPEAKPVTPGLAAMEADPRRTHREWRPLYGRVSKCDSCDGRSPGVLQECCDKRCSVRLCEGCARGNLWHSQHRTHFIDADKCDWTIRKQITKPRRIAPRARPAQRSGDSEVPIQPASRKRRVHFEDEEDEEDEEEHRPAKRVQREAPREHPQPPIHPAYHPQPPVIGRTPLPSNAPPRRTAGPSSLRYSETYTRESTSQVNWPSAETVQLADAAVRGHGRREAEGHTFQTPPMPPRRQEPPRHNEMRTAQTQDYNAAARDHQHRAYMSLPPTEHRSARDSGSMPPPPVPNRPDPRSTHGTGYRAVAGPSDGQPTQQPIQNQPVPLSPAEIRQVKTLYTLIVGTDYAGDARSYLRPPIPKELIRDQPPASLDVSQAPRTPYVPSLRSAPKPHPHNELTPSQLQTAHNDNHITHCVRRAWNSNNQVTILREFWGDSAILLLFWDVFNLYCAQNSLRDTPNATNWFVSRKQDVDFEIDRAAVLEMFARRGAEREERKRQEQEQERERERERERRRSGGSGY